MKDQAMTPPGTARIAAGFRRGLPSYAAAARVQAQIARNLAARLVEAGAGPNLPKAFEFGCGTGALTEALRQLFRVDQMWLNDLLPECRNVAKPGEHFLAGPVEGLTLPGDLNLIASASTIQWLPDLSGALTRFSAALTPGGWLALSGFGTAQFRELAALGSDGAAPGYLNAEDWPAILPGGVEVMHLSQSRVTLHFDDAISVLRHLRATGVNGVAGQQWSRRRLTNFDVDYRTRFAIAKGLPLTYDPVWIIARKTY